MTATVGAMSSQNQHRLAPLISICICSFNRAQSLRKTLESLQALSPIDAPYEILVIDNNSSDGTREVVDSFRERLPIRYQFEARQGLAHARNRAIDEFRGELLLFTDDDLSMDPQWLVEYLAAFRRFPDAAFFGGRILPAFADGKPPWIGDRPLHLIDGLLGWYDLGEETRPFLPDDPLPFGASFAIARATLARAPAFRTDLGAGMSAGRGEETEYLQRARASASSVYVGRALNHHAVDVRRLTPGALFKYGIACGRSHNEIAATPHRGTLSSACWFLVAGFWQAMKGRGDYARQCLVNAGIEVGARAASRMAPL